MIMKARNHGLQDEQKKQGVNAMSDMKLRTCPNWVRATWRLVELASMRLALKFQSQMKSELLKDKNKASYSFLQQRHVKRPS